MSEININQTDLNITVTPDTYTLGIYTGGYACAQGNSTEVQFNNNGVLGGANGLTYNQGTQTTTAGNLVVTNNTDLGAIGNITITGGNSGEVLHTDGSGGLSWAEVANANFASFAGNIIEAAQPNITSVGNLSNLVVVGNVTANYFLGNGSQLTGLAPGDSISNGSSNVRVLSANGNITMGVNGNANVFVATATGIQVPGANLGSVNNLVITGGNNGMVLQTDGTGNLTWTTMTGNAGNGTVGGSNTQIQYNDGGAFGGSPGFTFNKASNLLLAPGAITAVGNIQGNFIKGNGAFLTGIVAATANAIVNGSSNVTVDANANVRFSVSGVSNVMTVTSQDVNIANANISITGTGTFIGNASGLTNIPAANITGTVANANYSAFAGNATIATTATSATTAGTVTTNAQPNITSLGTLTSLSISGNLSAALLTGTLATAAQPNVTSLGNLTSLNVAGTTSIQQAIEKVTTNAVGSASTVNFDVLTQSILYKSANATANYTLNVRGNSSTTLNSVLANNQSITIAYINTNGSTPYIANTFQIDGVNVTPIFSPGSNTSFGGTANGKDIYTYNIIKTNTNTYVVFASKIGFS